MVKTNTKIATSAFVQFAKSNPEMSLALMTSSSKACMAEDLKHRAEVQNALKGACEDMCKEVGAYPKCSCPDFVPPDATPNVMTWPELYEKMDALVVKGKEMLKAAKAR